MDCEKVSIPLQNKNDKNGARSDGSTPLYVAAQEGRFEIVRYLVEAGADVSKPINTAVSNRHRDVVRILIQSRDKAQKTREFIQSGMSPTL